MACDATDPGVAAAVLAAGRGERMGGPKHLLPVAGVPMLERVLRALRGAGFDEPLAVLRAGDAQGRDLGTRLEARVVFAESEHEGRAASVRAAVRATDSESVGLLIALADQPILEARDFRKLLDAFRSGDSGIVHASYEGQRGTPVIFARRFFPHLLELRGSEGGRKVIAAHRDDACGVELPAERGRDLDRPEDL